MKKLILLCALLSGCSLLPTPHDPALVMVWTDVKLEINRVNCADTSTEDWTRLQRRADFMRAYADFRRDNQQKTTQGIAENITRARSSSPRVCEHWIKLTDQRLKVLEQAWSGR